MPVLQQMLIFFIMMGIGMYARKKNMLTKDNQSQISSIVVNIAYPAIILSGAVSEGERIQGTDLLIAVGAACGLLVLAMIGAYLLPIILRYPKNQRGIINVMVVFTNIGFMGVPMIDGLYGKSALIYMTVFLIPFNLLFFSYAIQTIRGKKDPNQKFSLKSLLNNGMIACFLSIIIYLADIRLPYFITSSIHMVGATTAPLAMMLMGSFLMDIRWSEIFTDRKIILFTIIKMIVIPVVIVFILGQFVHNNLLLAVCMAVLATPSGNVIALLAALYNKEAYPVSVKGIALTTLVSVFTMPLVFMLAGLE